MKLRIFLYKPDDLLLASLPQFLENLGHDVVLRQIGQRRAQGHDLVSLALYCLAVGSLEWFQEGIEHLPDRLLRVRAGLIGQ